MSTPSYVVAALIFLLALLEPWKLARSWLFFETLGRTRLSYFSIKTRSAPSASVSSRHHCDHRQRRSWSVHLSSRPSWGMSTSFSSESDSMKSLFCLSDQLKCPRTPSSKLWPLCLLCASSRSMPTPGCPSHCCCLCCPVSESSCWLKKRCISEEWTCWRWWGLLLAFYSHFVENSWMSLSFVCSSCRRQSCARRSPSCLSG